MPDAIAATCHVSQLRPGDHTVVVGAGPAGLTAAHVLGKIGQRVTILEGDTAVGGISRAAREIEAVHGIPRHRLRVALEAPAEAYRPAPSADGEGASHRAGITPGASWFTYVGEPAGA